MKVKNNLKSVLVLKSLDGNCLNVKPDETVSFKPEELGMYSKSIAYYMKIDWLLEVKETKNQPKAKKSEQVEDVKAPKKSRARQ